ncbi:helix-turn-helix transcriptional regulator [Pontibacter sp. SGAir0037]|uniref:ArsR/SmtB family transcription factor n=1 Tax=Pontibacter sp. SGAir0037 TaxID=2571030 RepID=UPI0010CD4B49|nr:metalloregulator ArsR/SmtB family transcription factor [Pontibacter sp. SGAir0037]QCR21286.1 transcriptional regulator [Pontibacter sp. SGAir0037]
MGTLKVRVDQKKLERSAYILKCLAHPVRISIIDLLEQSQQLTVSELQEALHIEQSLLSHHLINMRDKGILDTYRSGKNVYYSILDTNLTNIVSFLTR